MCWSPTVRVESCLGYRLVKSGRSTRYEAMAKNVTRVVGTSSLVLGFRNFGPGLASRKTAGWGRADLATMARFWLEAALGAARRVTCPLSSPSSRVLTDSVDLEEQAERPVDKRRVLGVARRMSCAGTQCWMSGISSLGEVKGSPWQAVLPGR
jgi:hypothetical protein